MFGRDLARLGPQGTDPVLYLSLAPVIPQLEKQGVTSWEMCGTHIDLDCEAKVVGLYGGQSL